MCRTLGAVLSQGAVVVSPDVGRVKMATEYAHRLGTSVIILHKQRQSAAETTITHVVGDVRDRACLIIDDMISTGGTIADAVAALLDAGAKPEITVAATHGLLLDGAQERLGLPSIRQISTTDTIRPHGSLPNWRVVSVGPLLAEAIRRSLSERPTNKLANGLGTPIA